VDDVARLRVVAVVPDEDLQPDDDVGAVSGSSPQQPAAVGLCPQGLLMDANNVVSMTISTTAVTITTLLPEMEDASLDPWKHGGTEEVTTSVYGVCAVVRGEGVEERWVFKDTWCPQNGSSRLEHPH
jgi:hypothetical protein